MLHESTHLRNTVAGHNALTPSAEPFAFRNGAIMQDSNNNAAHTGLPTPGVTRANLDYGRAVNEPRDMAGQVFGSTIQKDVMGDADSFQKHLNKHMNTSDQQRSADVQKELMRIGVAITKLADDENLAEPSSYLNQMMYLMYENQDMFDSAFFDSNRFKALQHYTGILNDTTNYGKAENGGVGIRNLTSYGRAGKKRQKPTTESQNMCSFQQSYKEVLSMSYQYATRKRTETAAPQNGKGCASRPLHGCAAGRRCGAYPADAGPQGRPAQRHPPKDGGLLPGGPVFRPAL